jgi:hypothetical protein
VYAATRDRASLAALVAGALVALVALLGWRVDGGAERPPASISVSAESSSDLAVEPALGEPRRVELRGSAPDEGLTRDLVVTNATGEALDFRVVARSRSRDLDRALHVRIQVAGRAVYDGELAGLRRGSEPFSLASHERAAFRLSAWIPMNTGGEWHARAADVELRFETLS